MPALVAFKSLAKPQARRLTLLLPQDCYRFVEAWEGKDSFFYNERFIDPGFDRQDIDAPAQFVEAAAAPGLQTRHATAARHSHHSHARR
ncbi:MAG: hypothetical protein A3H35_17355 [Betaproteobacteria bacterium RIFCSPLOWO2_02_FULL_62_17]|nr:MAG: hypothetical protein A3H35_17355 [Betaproteobacteria bacterium RIFCSPLOWO2_02_FULL_62_17]